MAKVEIYTTAFCPYCLAAKELLGKKGIAFEETDCTFDPDKRREAAQRSGRNTVPQIWIDGRHIGGYDELEALESEGKLDPVLMGQS